MIHANNMFLIGAADRNVGKTEFACSLIKKLASEDKESIAVKVTAIRNNDGQCPRGGKGCGVCASISGNFCVEEERNPEGSKDTSRMLKAGAKAVFWLKILTEHLESGCSELLGEIEKRFGKNIPIICESNSLRNVVEPGLFFVLNRKGNENIKETCRKVKHLADKEVTLISEEDGLDFGINKISFVNGCWYFKTDACAIILAGGKSSRMGNDKALLNANGKPMISLITEQLMPLFDNLIIGANDSVKFPKLNAQVVPDKIQGMGPLMAIYSCLEQSKSDINFITGCDIPNMNIPLIIQMLRKAKEFDVVVPRLQDGKVEPLYAVYRKSVIAHIPGIFESGNSKICSLFDKVNTFYFPLEQPRWYFNLNTVSDYAEYLRTAAI